jgi:hypothetical protein
MTAQGQMEPATPKNQQKIQEQSFSTQYDELPAVDAHRFSEASTAAYGRKHEFDMMPESGRTGDVLVQPQGAG